MIDDMKPEERGPERPPEPKLPRSGEEILREVERLKGEPIQVRCLGMSLTTIVLAAVLAWILWRILR